jgi:chromosome segregation ATPase
MKVNHKTLQDEQNAVAHLAILKKEIAEATATLTTTINKNSLLQKENEVIRAESDRLLADARIVYEQAKKTHITAQSELADATKRSAETDALVASTNDRLISELEKHQSKLDSMTLEQARLDNELTHTQVLIEVHKPLLNSLVSELGQYQLTFNEIRAKIDSLTNEYIETKSQKESELNLLDRSIESKKQELAQYIQLVNDEKQKIESPILALKEEEKRIDAKRRDLTIYESRVRQHFADTFPDKLMRI